MAYTTNLQQVLQYLKAGGKLQPAAGAGAVGTPQTQPPALPFGNAPSGASKQRGGMPMGPPPKVSK